MENTLRIYVFIAGFHPLVGGSEQQCLAQCRCLRARGCEVTVITFCHDSAWLRSDAVEGMPVMRIAGAVLGRREKLPRLAQRLLYMLALVVLGWTLWRHRARYDLVHLYNLGQLVLPCALVCRLTGRPLLIEVQGAGGGKAETDPKGASLIAGPLDSLTPWLRVSGRARVGGDLESLERLGKPAVRGTLALLRSVGAAVIVKSSRSREYLLAHDFLLPGVQLTPNGVDIARFTPGNGPATSTEKAQTVVCVSRLSYEKGIDVLLQAWRIVHGQVPQARLIIVGSGPLQTQLERLAAALGTAESVEFAGMQRDVVTQLHRAALAVLPSRIEGMPNALLEAMGCGLACVATRVSGSEDLLQQGMNGLLVEPEDYPALAQALLVLMRDPALAQKYGHLARLTVEQHYSQEHIAAQYIELYESLVMKAGAALKSADRIPVAGASSRRQSNSSKGVK